MLLWRYMMGPKPNVNVFFEQKTVHLMNRAWDPFQVPGPISNPSLDIRGKSFLNGKDVQLAQPAFVVCNALKCNTLGGVVVSPIQLLGLLIEGLQARVVDVALIIPLMSVGGQPSGSFAQWAWQHLSNRCREQSLQPGLYDLLRKNILR